MKESIALRPETYQSACKVALWLHAQPEDAYSNRQISEAMGLKRWDIVNWCKAVPEVIQSVHGRIVPQTPIPTYDQIMQSRHEAGEKPNVPYQVSPNTARMYRAKPAERLAAAAASGSIPVGVYDNAQARELAKSYPATKDAAEGLMTLTMHVFMSQAVAGGDKHAFVAAAAWLRVWAREFEQRSNNSAAKSNND
jgi:hypothetical protein